MNVKMKAQETSTLSQPKKLASRIQTSPQSQSNSSYQSQPMSQSNPFHQRETIKSSALPDYGLHSDRSRGEFAVSAAISPADSASTATTSKSLRRKSRFNQCRYSILSRHPSSQPDLSLSTYRTLDGDAAKCFASLPPGSLKDFEDLAQKVMTQYSYLMGEQARLLHSLKREDFPTYSKRYREKGRRELAVPFRLRDSSCFCAFPLAIGNTSCAC
ncbi:hypothetical protein Q3G72_013362 [Acer saccharum]|nr:hypothetical protein Q3G72_013362 [Acer saccharum]